MDTTLRMTGNGITDLLERAKTIARQEAIKSMLASTGEQAIISTDEPSNRQLEGGPDRAVQILDEIIQQGKGKGRQARVRSNSKSQTNSNILKKEAVKKEAVKKEARVETRRQARSIALEEKGTKTDHRRIAFGLMVFGLSMMVAITVLVYNRREGLAQTAQNQVSYSNSQQNVGKNPELLDLVCKARAKTPGFTVAQAITNHLNNRIGSNWQAVGWKAEPSADNQNISTVKFLWVEKGVNREASWKVDLSTNKVTPVSETAISVGP